MKWTALLGMLLWLCGCAATVEEVTLTRYSKTAARYRNKDTLTVTVNTKKDLFQGRESFLNFRRDYYIFSMLTKTNAGLGKDMVTFTYGRPVDGIVEIDEQADTNRIVVKIHFTDDKIPRLMNGVYSLKFWCAERDCISYKTK